MKFSFLESEKNEIKKYNKLIKLLQKRNIMYEACDTHEWCGDYKIYFIAVTFDDKYYDSIKNEIDLIF